MGVERFVGDGRFVGEGRFVGKGRFEGEDAPPEKQSAEEGGFDGRNKSIEFM